MKKKVWHCSYDERMGWGAFQQYECVVFAYLPDQALSAALAAYPDTTPRGWTAEELKGDENDAPLVFPISSCSH